jgi:hypothetical protein
MGNFACLLDNHKRWHLFQEDRAKYVKTFVILRSAVHYWKLKSDGEDEDQDEDQDEHEWNDSDSDTIDDKISKAIIGICQPGRQIRAFA